MNDLYYKELDGQLSFLEPVEKSVPDFILFVRQNIKQLQTEIILLEKFNIFEKQQMVKKDFYTFIVSFFEIYHSLSLEETLFIIENYSSEYHNLCKLFLEYLERFLFSKGIAENIEDSFTIEIENFILNDQVKFRNIYYLHIIETIMKRKKLRVNNYLVFRGNALLNRLNFLEDQSFMNEELDLVVKSLAKDELFLKCPDDFLEENGKSTLSMFILYYLENNKVEKTIRERLELFVVYYLTDTFLLNDFQKQMFERVKINVATYVKKYILTYAPQIKSHLEDFISLSKFNKSGKVRMIEENELLDDLPKLIGKEELKLEIENFLNVVFMLDSTLSKQQLPIFSNDIIKERHLSLELALYYFSLFVYPEHLENSKIERLEDYLVEEPHFVVQNSFLCMTKSKMYDKVNRRNIKDSISKKRNLLQTKKN